MTALIEEGAGEMDSLAFAEARDGLAAELSFGSYDDSVSVSARFLTENRDQAMDLLRQALINPRFDQDAVDRVREQVLSNLRSNEKDPDSLASEAFNALAFGDHPYGSSGDGTTATVTALTRDDILAAHKGALARDRIYVAAAGDIQSGGDSASGSTLPPLVTSLRPNLAPFWTSSLAICPPRAPRCPPAPTGCWLRASA